MEDDEKKIVASGIWYYGKSVPEKIYIYAVPAKYSTSRYDEDDELVESAPIPETLDGFVYKTNFGGEARTVEEIKKWADSQPWGPCIWGVK